MKHLKPALVAATLILVGGTTAACGGAPDDASQADFCDAYVGGTADILKAGDDDKKMAAAVNDWGDKLEDTGTPDDIGEDARKGFEAVVDEAKDVEADDVKDFESQDAFDGDEKGQVEALGKYVGDNCADQIEEESGDITSDLPTDLPTDLPSDLPTEDLSDLPTDLPTE